MPFFTASATLREFRERHPTIFESICLQMDHHNNWKALGLSISIPDETLQQIATSTSCAKTVFDIIEKKNPRLTVKEMRGVLKEMLREDVCKVLEKYLLGIIFYFWFSKAHWKRADHFDSQ